MRWNADSLDEYVQLVDQVGIGSTRCQELWADFDIELKTIVDQSLDPYSEEYVSQQVELYRELSGHHYSSSIDEMTEFVMDDHVRAPNPYNHPDPGELALHIQRLTRAFQLASPKIGQTLIDFGCGWGLSSEIAAYIGLNVYAVDVNPKFVDLVNARAITGDRRVTAITSTFEEFTAKSPTDFMLFYECLHHAVRPWEALRNVLQSLRPEGKLIVAGEPINDNWWVNWGMRLDPESIYCIRKFGWFESGWSQPFLIDLIRRQGLDVEFFQREHPRMGDVVIATKPALFSLSGSEVKSYGSVEGGHSVDGHLLGLFGDGVLHINAPPGLLLSYVTITSARPRSLAISVAMQGKVLFEGGIGDSELVVDIPTASSSVSLEFHVEKWIPDNEIGNGDHREIGVHLKSLSFVRPN